MGCGLIEVLSELLNGSFCILKGVSAYRSYRSFSERFEVDNLNNNETDDISSLLKYEYKEPNSYLIEDKR